MKLDTNAARAAALTELGIRLVEGPIVGFKRLVQRDECFSPRMELKNKDWIGYRWDVGT